MIAATKLLGTSTVRENFQNDFLPGLPMSALVELEKALQSMPLHELLADVRAAQDDEWPAIEAACDYNGEELNLVFDLGGEA